MTISGNRQGLAILAAILVRIHLDKAHMGLAATKPVLGGFQTTKGQISALAFRLLESIIYRLATSEISVFQLVSVAVKTGLRLLCGKPRRQVLSQRGPYLNFGERLIKVMHIGILKEIR